MPYVLIVTISALAALLLNAGFHSGTFPGLLFFCIHLLISAAGFALWKRNENRSTIALVWLGLSLLLTPWLFIRDSGWLYFFNIVTPAVLVGLFFVNAYSISFQKICMSVALPLQVLRLMLTKMGEPLRRLLDRVPFLQEDRQKWFRGLFLAFPVLLVVFLLLYSADLVFAQYTDAIISFERFFKNITHVFTVLYFFLFSGLLYSLIRKREVIEADGVIVREQDKYVLRIIAALVGVLLLLFSWIQLKYLFLNSGRLGELGIGYQQYAHQGFYQLVVVAIIVFAVIWFLSKVRVNGDIDTRLNRFDTGIVLVLLAEILLLLASAMKRLWLFVDALEWAPRRFFAIEGMGFFAAIMVLFIVHLFVKKFTRQQFLFAFTVLFTINIFALNIFNPDNFIAKQNAERYIEGGAEHELDYDYTSYVSADGVEEGLLLYDNARTPREKERSARRLHSAWQRLDRYNDIREVKWHSYHVAKQRAFELLNPREEELINSIQQYEKEQEQQSSAEEPTPSTKPANKE